MTTDESTECCYDCSIDSVRLFHYSVRRKEDNKEDPVDDDETPVDGKMAGRLETLQRT